MNQVKIDQGFSNFFEKIRNGHSAIFRMVHGPRKQLVGGRACPFVINSAMSGSDLDNATLSSSIAFIRFKSAFNPPSENGGFWVHMRWSTYNLWGLLPTVPSFFWGLFHNHHLYVRLANTHTLSVSKRVRYILRHSRTSRHSWRWMKDLYVIYTSLYTIRTQFSSRCDKKPVCMSLPVVIRAKFL